MHDTNQATTTARPGTWQVRHVRLAALGLSWMMLGAVWLLLMLVASAVSAADVNHAATGKIVSARGDTSLSRTGEVVTPADRKPHLQQGDRLRTGGNGHMELLFTDGMRMSLGPGTQLTISDYAMARGAQRSWFDMARGTLRTITGMIGKNDPAAFRLRTPTAVVGVRGTDFTVVQADCPGGYCRDPDAAAMQVAVTAGEVDVVGTGGVVSVAAGQTATIGKPGQMPTVAPTINSLSPALPPITSLPPATTGSTPRQAGGTMAQPPFVAPSGSPSPVSRDRKPASTNVHGADERRAPSIAPLPEASAQPPQKPAATLKPQQAGDFGAW